MFSVNVGLCHNTAAFSYGKCSCKASASGRCKQFVALSYQPCNYLQLDLKSVPGGKTCTDTLQQWYVPSESGKAGAIFFS